MNIYKEVQGALGEILDLGEMDISPEIMPQWQKNFKRLIDVVFLRCFFLRLTMMMS